MLCIPYYLISMSFDQLITMQIADYFVNGGSNPNQFAIGLEETFHEVHGHDIGQFPGTDSQKVAIDESQMVLTS